MPKSTFNNLTDERKEEIIDACIAEFSLHNINEASVANIITRLNIARGTFYKYFNDIEDCYFYILSKETIEIHDLLIELMHKENFNMQSSLEQYGEKIANEIYKPATYHLYKNRYLAWNGATQIKWREYVKNKKLTSSEIENIFNSSYSLENMHILKAVIHDLVQRIYLEDWTKTEFLQKYQEQMSILKQGMVY